MAFNQKGPNRINLPGPSIAADQYQSVAIIF